MHGQQLFLGTEGQVFEGGRYHPALLLVHPGEVVGLCENVLGLAEVSLDADELFLGVQHGIEPSGDALHLLGEPGAIHRKEHLAGLVLFRRPLPVPVPGPADPDHISLPHLALHPDGPPLQQTVAAVVDYPPVAVEEHASFWIVPVALLPLRQRGEADSQGRDVSILVVPGADDLHFKVRVLESLVEGISREDECPPRQAFLHRGLPVVRHGEATVSENYGPDGREPEAGVPRIEAALPELLRTGRCRRLDAVPVQRLQVAVGRLQRVHPVSRKAVLGQALEHVHGVAGPLQKERCSLRLCHVEREQLAGLRLDVRRQPGGHQAQRLSIPIRRKGRAEVVYPVSVRNQEILDGSNHLRSQGLEERE